MARDSQDFLRRWSRRKQDAAAQSKAPAAPNKDAPAPALPPLDSLTFESDFKAFMHAKVEESVKRAALKKLFADPRFNVMDGLDVYIDDYSKPNPIPAAMLAGLRQAQQILERAKELEAEQAARESASAKPASETSPAAIPDARPEEPNSEPSRTAERVDVRTNS